MTTLRVLHVVGGYPTPQRPHNQVFLQTQIESLIGGRGPVRGPRPARPPRRQVRHRLAPGPARTARARRSTCSTRTMRTAPSSASAMACRWSPPCSAATWSGFAGSDGRHSGLCAPQPPRAGAVRRGAVPRRASSSRSACGTTSASRSTSSRTGSTLAQFQPLSPGKRAEVRAALGLAPETRYVLFAGDPRRPLKRYPLAQAAVAPRPRSVPFPARVAALSGHSHARRDPAHAGLRPAPADLDLGGLAERGEGGDGRGHGRGVGRRRRHAGTARRRLGLPRHRPRRRRHHRRGDRRGPDCRENRAKGRHAVALAAHRGGRRADHRDLRGRGARLVDLRPTGLPTGARLR